MSERDDIENTPRAAKARESVRALSSPEADPAFRESLEHEFTSGEWARPRIVGLKPARRHLGWVWAQAAAAVVVAVLLAMLRSPGWSVVAATGEGIAVVDGRPVTISHTEELARMIHAGCRLEVPPGCSITLASRGRLLIEVTSDTRITLPAVPRRWFGEPRAQVEHGVIFVTTGRNFHGARLAIATPLASVEVTGTSLAVISQPEGTCVCVMEGRVRVTPRGAPTSASAMVAGGHRRLIYADRRSPETLTILESSEHELHRLGAEHAALLLHGRD